MLIKVEPAGFFMYSVQMIFDLTNPDAEDGPVRDYLADHQLEPRYQSTGEYEGRPCEVMQFGGCYLGRHLQEVGQLQRQAVEAELLTTELESCLAALSPELDAAAAAELDATAPELGLPEQRRREIAAALTPTFHRAGSFQPNEQGELAIVLDRDEVRAAARQWLRENGNLG